MTELNEHTEHGFCSATKKKHMNLEHDFKFLLYTVHSTDTDCLMNTCSYFSTTKRFQLHILKFAWQGDKNVVVSSIISLDSAYNTDDK